MKRKILISTVTFALMTGVAAPFAGATSPQTYESSPLNTKETLSDGTIVETVYEEGDVPIPYNTPTSKISVDRLALSSNSVVSPAAVYGSTWISAGTKKYSQKMVWTTAAAASAGIGLYLKIPHFSGAALLINYVIANKNSWVYYSDKQYFRMAGATLQIKHVVTFYKDSARTKKINSQTYITNDNGGK
ncbi:hypothetical protein [Planococcus wigleyi]|uniref:Surface layer protein A domain-containing protein n=1 Tax=Planococcus wigleyi TaxID=2762216 RepID=A0ABR8WIQ9_9BACL|nr:hypothetical protein [Planococcus wigleyi]MBD8016812.1 hypothetical protein [Planococcus wigleyi]